MSTTALAMLLKPIGTLLIMGGIVLPIKLLFQRYLPEGRLKRILFKKLN